MAPGTGGGPEDERPHRANGLGFGGASRLSLYEAGAFTPSIRGGTMAGSPTMLQTEGVFVRIGSLANVWCRLIWNVQGGMAGVLSLTGPSLSLPRRPRHRAALTTPWYNWLSMGAGVSMLGG